MKCANYGKNHSGGLCPWCGHVDEAPKPSEAQIASAWRRSEQRHGVPALLSFFVPGLGQLIKGNIGTAFIVWAGLSIFVGVGLAGLWLTFLGIPVLWCWSLYDAYVAPDGPARRELDRIAKTMIVLVACGLAVAGAGCGSVTAKATEDDGGTGGAGGKLGVESGAGGDGSSTGGASPATGGTGGQAAGTGGAQATGGSGGAPAGTGGNPGTGGIACSGSLSLCGASCVDLEANANCGSCGHSCAAGQTCTNGICAETCESEGWTPSGCTRCPSGTKTGKPCSVCNVPSWFTGGSSCQEGDASSGFLVAASCSACSTF